MYRSPLTLVPVLLFAAAGLLVSVLDGARAERLTTLLEASDTRVPVTRPTFGDARAGERERMVR
ncbi:MAG: hypothetical protein R3225_10355, partial [Halofilum sp. (in: g-proteobacteria)]|nr:hypothetical protein [Halofilum sp. (in: g-proteobacteria)]